MKFSAIFKPTSLFSLKDSKSTNSGAKSLFLPSPYAIKMAVLNQAITAGNQLEELSSNNSTKFKYISNAKISFRITSGFCVNNAFIKIQRLKEDKRNKKQKEVGVKFIPGFSSTVSFREFVHIPGNIEIIFDVESEDAKLYLMKFVYKINYFGKRGSFFQFVNYNENPAECNVKDFISNEFIPGIIQQYDDFPEDATFQKVSNYSNKSIKRGKRLLVVPVASRNSSKSYSSYSFD